MVFTIPEQLRPIFKTDHSLLKVLMDAVSRTLKKTIRDKRKATPGLIAVLHPYGKVLNLNPHVHVLATEGGLTGKGEWIPVKYIIYRKLRRIYQYELLTTIKKNIPKTPQNSRFIDTLFKKYPEGFYVRAKRRVRSSERRDVARYIGRYVRHPAIAESRITEFNPETNTVTFWYRDGEGWNSVTKKVTMPAMEFINRLVKLIPDKHLKLVRYYGLYSRRTRSKLQKFLTPLSRQKPKNKPRKETVKCPECGTPMELIGVTRSS